MLFVRRLVLGVLAVSWFFSACEVIEAPYFEPEYLNGLPAEDQCFIEAQNIDPFPDGYVFTKKILLEKMTGHRCGNCPPAASEGVRLLEANPDRIVYLSIHAGPLSNFSSSASKYSTNFKIDASNDIFNTLNTIGGVPFGMIDRNFTSIDEQTWQTEVQKRLETPATAGINIFSCYDADSQDLAVVVRATFLEEVQETDRLAIYLAEDQIIDWQKDYSAPGGQTDIENYSHRQVLRTAFNGTWGEPVTEGSIEVGTVYTKGYSLKLSKDWNPENCNIIAFLYNPDTYEIRQVEQVGI